MTMTGAANTVKVYVDCTQLTNLSNAWQAYLATCPWKGYQGILNSLQSRGEITAENLGWFLTQLNELCVVVVRQMMTTHTYQYTKPTQLLKKTMMTVLVGVLEKLELDKSRPNTIKKHLELTKSWMEAICHFYALLTFLGTYLNCQEELK